MIRVASYNMRKAIGTDRRRRPERTIEVLNELDADVDRAAGGGPALRLEGERDPARHARRAQRLQAGRDRHPRRLHRLARQRPAGAQGDRGARASSVPLPSLEPRGAVLAELCESSITSSTCPRSSRAARCSPTCVVDGALLRVRRHASRPFRPVAAAAGAGDPLPSPRARRRAADGADGRPQRMEHARRLPARVRRRSRFRALRPQLPRPPPDRLARPDHGQPRPRGGGQRRPPHRLLAPRLRPSADLGGTGPRTRALSDRPA